MTRFLSESLQAPEPFFRLGLRRLEVANGNPNTDIRFTTEVMHSTHAKLRQLGLDPRDTTAKELYQALQERVKSDDARLVKILRTLAATHISAEGDAVAGMIHVLKGLPDSKRCFALKHSKLKAMIKKQPPKKAMKRLGYRSFESCLKHENPVLLLAAAWLTEGQQWQERFTEQYRQVKSADFEDRNILIIKAQYKHWQDLAQTVVAQNKHNILCFKELGSMVILPLPNEVPKGAVTASMTLGLHELNEIRSSSTFLKLSQMRPDFGKTVQAVVAGQPQLSSQLLDKPMPWNLIQRYYAQLGSNIRETIFEPYMQIEDMAWHAVEKSLARIEPSFGFWQDSGHLGLLHGQQPVSLNLVDAALNYCNQLPFERRLVHYFQRSLWHELLLRYLQHDSVEQSVLSELQPALALETVQA